MAGGGGGDDEENYWPGFVDALTTMTMVLVFIMMVMGLVIFSLSQNTSREKLTQIAQALNVDPKAPTMEKLQANIMAAVTEKMASKDQASSPQASSQQAAPSPAAPQSTQAPTPSSASKAEPKPVTPSPEAAKVASSVADTAKAPKPTDATDTKPAALGQEKAPRAPTQMMTGEAPTATDIPVEQAKVSDVTADGADRRFTIRYADRSFQISEEVKLAVDAFLTRSGALSATGAVDVRSFANTAVGGVSEARRVAYYRSMIVRQQLVSAGIPSTRIRIKVDDSSRPEDDNSVQILVP